MKVVAPDNEIQYIWRRILEEDSGGTMEDLPSSPTMTLPIPTTIVAAMDGSNAQQQQLTLDQATTTTSTTVAPAACSVRIINRNQFYISFTHILKSIFISKQLFLFI